MSNLFDELKNIVDKYFDDFFLEKAEEDSVVNISISAEAIAPKKISVQSIIPDADNYYEFVENIDTAISNIFVDIFKKGENVEGSIIDITFTYKDTSIQLGLTAKKSKSKKIRKSNKEVDWYSISISNLEIDSRDSQFKQNQTFVEKIQNKLKQKRIKSDSPEYIKSVFNSIKSFLDEQENKRNEKIKEADVEIQDE